MLCSVVSKAADKFKRASRETFSASKEERTINCFQKCSFDVMSGSISRLKATVEIFCREMFKELRKKQKQNSMIMETNERLERGRRFFNLLGQEGFLRRGVTGAV